MTPALHCIGTRTRSRDSGAERKVGKRASNLNELTERGAVSIKKKERDQAHDTSVLPGKQSNQVEPVDIGNPTGATNYGGTVVQQQGSFHIVRFRIQTGRDKDQLELGIRFQRNDWPNSGTIKAFPHSTVFCVVSEVIRESLAAKAGVQEKDLICAPKNGVVPFAFHALMSSASGEESATWILIGEDELLNRWKQSQNGKMFTFYVARKVPAVRSASDCSPNLPVVQNGPSISAEVAQVLCKDFPKSSQKEKNSLLKLVKDDAEKIFRSDVSAIMQSLPIRYTNLFNKLGFARFGKQTRCNWNPVLVVNPFNVPPGPARSLWLQKYKMRKEKKKLDCMNLLVYWYGERETCSDRFALILQNDFIDWSMGVQCRLHEINQTIQTKIQKKQKLSRAEEIRVRAQEEVENDLKLLPKDLETKFFPFQEHYATLTVEDLHNFTSSSNAGESSGSGYKRTKKTTSFAEGQTKKHRSNRNSGSRDDNDITAAKDNYEVAVVKPSAAMDAEVSSEPHASGSPENPPIRLHSGGETSHAASTHLSKCSCAACHSGSFGYSLSSFDEKYDLSRIFVNMYQRMDHYMNLDKSLLGNNRLLHSQCNNLSDFVRKSRADYLKYKHAIVSLSSKDVDVQVEEAPSRKQGDHVTVDRFAPKQLIQPPTFYPSMSDGEDFEAWSAFRKKIMEQNEELKARLETLEDRVNYWSQKKSALQSSILKQVENIDSDDDEHDDYDEDDTPSK